MQYKHVACFIYYLSSTICLLAMLCVDCNVGEVVSILVQFVLSATRRGLPILAQVPFSISEC